MSATLYNINPQGLQAESVFQFSYLTSRYHLATKIIYADGKETPYDHALNFQFQYGNANTLEELASDLVWLAPKKKTFIIRGKLKPGLAPGGWHRRLIYPKDKDPATIESTPLQWIVLDFDGTQVPHGLGAPDKLAEAAMYVRDKMMPPYFRGIRCVASVSASTGRRGPTTFRGRMFFGLTRCHAHEALLMWSEQFSRDHLELKLDPSVMRAAQPIYTARPEFRGCTDPVPEWGRVRIIDGYQDQLRLDIPRAYKRELRSVPTVHVCDDLPAELMDLTEADAGLGVHPIEEAKEISSRAWTAIKRIFEMLDGCPKHGVGRHESLNRAAWELVRLVDEGELPKAKAREAFLKAAEGINNWDDKYDDVVIQRHIDDAFEDCGRR
jgi:hypothetical protein